jgi:hypothetical protein
MPTSAFPSEAYLECKLSIMLGQLIHLQVGQAQLRALPRSLLGASMYLSHVIAFAVIAKRISKISFRFAVANTAFFTLGYALFGFYIWVAGYLYLLSFEFFLSSSVIWAILAVFLCRRHSIVRRISASVRSVASLNPFSAGVFAAILAISIISGLRSVAFDDNYKWQSAMFWVRAGHWVKVPYRLTNGPAMSEMLHIPAAVCGSLTSAHWASTGLWVCAVLNAAALGRVLAIPTPVTIVAILSVPVFTCSASILSSDITTVAFALAGMVMFSDRVQNQITGRSAFLAGVLFAGALSSKFLVLACLPGVLISFVLMRDRRLSICISATLILLVPVLLTACLWLVHTYHLTGSPIDPSGKHMARSPEDPMWMDGEAAGRIPHASDLVRLPVEPFLTTIWGQEEPFGGRTGLLWLLLLPATAVLFLKRKIDRAHAISFFAIALSFYFLLGPFVLKTRFLMLFFILMSILSASAFEHRRQFPRWTALTISALFLATATLGILDGTRKLLFEIVLNTPAARHGPRGV